MNLETLLLHLENHLKWLDQKKGNYLNVEALSKVDLETLLEDLVKNHSDTASNIPTSNGKLTETPEMVSSSQIPYAEMQTVQYGNLQHSLTSAVDLTMTALQNNFPPQETKAPTVESSPSGHNTLENLYQQVCHCQKCPLGKTRNQFVFGTGHPHPKVMFVGEAPGADEDQQGLPFVGKAGQLLTRMIHTLGLDRSDVYIANVVKCRPPNNRNPISDEILQCFPILQRQIELVNPELIVTLGNVPTQTLIPSAPGITRARGQIFNYQQWKVLPTFHPSYLLRNPSAMEDALKDFKQIEKLALES